ncbi:MAG: cobalt-precorrin-5B (C(1))-methyltransferase [Methanoregula sp.]|jgi:cobalt-precorrin-5B (C1)-methyltransferase
MRDPVSGFDYPETWVKKCQSPDLLRLVKEGLAVLTSSGKVLRRGYTTGTTAAAACKGAILSLSGIVITVAVQIPCGLIVQVPVSGSGGTASCKKFAGDYPDDVTAGCEFVAEAIPQKKGIQLLPGDGIGIFSRDTPRFRKGDPAISTAPLACILTSIEEAADLEGISGVKVRLNIPQGTVIAKRTLNPKVGVTGGISILGTTGLVEPWDDHLEESMCRRLSAAHNAVLTTGRIGLRYARLMYPDSEIVLVGSRICEALGASTGEVVLFGLPGLILRFINPHLLDGTGYETIEEFAVSSAFYPAMQSSITKFKKEYPHVRVVLVNRDGMVLGESA